MVKAFIAIAVLVCTLVLVLLGGYRVHAVNRDRAVAKFQAAELRVADDLAASLEHELVEAARTVRQVADALTQSPDTAAIDAMLERQGRCDEFPCFTGVAVFSAQDAVRSAGRAPDLPQPALVEALAWARDAGSSRRVRFVIASQQASSVVLLAPVRQGGIPTPGLVAAQLSLGPFFSTRLHAALPDGPELRALVISENGAIVFQSPHPEGHVTNVRARTDRCFGCHESLDHVERMLVSRRGTLGYRLRGVDQLAAVVPVAVNGGRWTVGLRAPRRHVVASLSADFWRIGGVAAAALALIAAAGFIAWRRDRRRVVVNADALYRTSLEHSVGDLTSRISTLERAAHEWRTAADTIDAAFIVLEPNGAIIRMNVAAAATLPDGLAAWLGRPSAQLAEYAPWNVALPLVDEAAAHQAVVTDRVRAGGRTWDLWCRALPARQPPAVLLMARDVTSVVDLQESLRRSETMAQLGSIVSGVAHEVRNPLFAISSLVDAWAVQSHRDPRPFVEALRGEVGRLRTLMVDLLEYGRPAKTTRQTQRLADVVDNAIQACTHEATSREVRVIASAFPDVEVVMDARRLERVFVNLVQNAIQHSPACSVVRVDGAATTNADRVAVTVRDSGPGFAPDDLPRIFTPFFSRRPGGFGLGLAISERIVTEHGGRIEAANDPAGGAVLTVTLPVACTRSRVASPQVQRV